MKFKHLLLVVAGLTVNATSHAGQSLDVVLAGVQHDRGQLRVGLYVEAKAFRKEAQALRVKTAAARAGELVLRFDELAPGRYAIMAYHDEDGNGELNRRFGMFPTEGYGLSNNPKPVGPPAFEDSAFDVPAPDDRVRIELHY